MCCFEPCGTRLVCAWFRLIIACRDRCAKSGMDPIAPTLQGKTRCGFNSVHALARSDRHVKLAYCYRLGTSIVDSRVSSRVRHTSRSREEYRYEARFYHVPGYITSSLVY